MWDFGSRAIFPEQGAVGRYSIGALIIRRGFWGPLYYNIIKEPPQKKNSLGNYFGPYIIGPLKGISYLEKTTLANISLKEENGSFRKLGVPNFGVLIIRILLFGVLYSGSALEGA